MNPMIAFYNPSPFNSHTEFLEVKGPFYTFAHQPGVIAFLLILCALGSLYFVYASFVIKKGTPAPKSPVMLSILLAMGLASAADTLYQQYQKQGDRPTASTPHQTSKSVSGLMPLTLLGMLGGGATVSKRPSRKSARATRNGSSHRARIR